MKLKYMDFMTALAILTDSFAKRKITEEVHSYS